MKARPARSKPSRRPAAEVTSPNAVPSVSGVRQWLVRGAAALLVPLVLLAGAEAASRVAGYGYDSGFFQKLRIGGRDYLVNNDAFSRRFFPPGAQRYPGVVRMETPKPAGVYRIFILGESAAMGDPSPAFGAGRYLEALLRERFPEREFEVVNVAFTAINSHVILPIARECAREQGDLWIVYMGNNEMVGPFGGATVFGAQAPPRAFVRASLALQQTRLGQLFVALGRKLNRNATTAASWRGLEMFTENRVSPQDARRERVIRNFEANLQDIVRAGLDSGAKVLLNTVAVNLRDCPPFASVVNSNLPIAEREAWGASFTNALRALGQGESTKALEEFGSAARLDAHVAEMQFRWAECLQATGDFGSARGHYQHACDDDALCFRATSRINAIIRKAGSQSAEPGLVLLDAAALLATNHPSGTCGQESFYEHVHFNFDGNYRLARAWAAQIELNLSPDARQRGVSVWATPEVCERRMGLTHWNRAFVIQSVLRRLREPPLSGQSNNPDRLATLGRHYRTLQEQMTPVEAVEARTALSAALKQSPNDPQLVENCADFLEAIGDLPAATEQRRRVLELLPQDCLAALQLGRALAKQDRGTEAEPLLRRAVEVRPNLTEGWFELGNLHARQGDFQQALVDYESASKSRPQDAMLDCCAAKTLIRLSRRAEGIERYRLAIRKHPDYWEAHYELGGELTQAERLAEALAAYREVVRIHPDFALGHFNLGVILARLSRWEDAEREFEVTLRWQPDHKEAQDYLDRVRALKAGSR